MELSIRRATADDAVALAEIGVTTFVETFGHLYPPQDLAQFLAENRGSAAIDRLLADPAEAIWVVEAAGDVVGYALAGRCKLPHGETAPAHGELKQLYMLKAWQSGGTGARLMQAVLDWLEDQGHPQVCIGVWSQNLGAQRFYGRFGFEKVGEYQFAVGGTRDAEFILQRRAARAT